MNILIVGATSGIGHELWKHYSLSGNRVAVMGRRRDILQQMMSMCPDTTLISCCDISDITDWSQHFQKIYLELGTIDVAVVCAGVGELNPELATAVEMDIISVNVVGWTNVVTSIYHRFAVQGYGHLVTITSVGGMQPTAMAPSYSASKSYQINYTKSLQIKSRKSNVVVTEIRPGLVNTRMAKGDGLFWVMPLEKVTNQILNAISRKKKLAIITRRWSIINYILKHFN